MTYVRAKSKRFINVCDLRFQPERGKGEGFHPLRLFMRYFEEHFEPVLATIDIVIAQSGLHVFMEK